MTTMLKSIYLSRDEYGVNKGKLTGKVEFCNQYGDVALRVDSERAGRIVEILAEALVETTRETASLMTSQIIEQAHGAVQLEG